MSGDTERRRQRWRQEMFLNSSARRLACHLLVTEKHSEAPRFNMLGTPNHLFIWVCGAKLISLTSIFFSTLTAPAVIFVDVAVLQQTWRRYRSPRLGGVGAVFLHRNRSGDTPSSRHLKTRRCRCRSAVTVSRCYRCGSLID